MLVYSKLWYTVYQSNCNLTLSDKRAQMLLLGQCFSNVYFFYLLGTNMYAFVPFFRECTFWNMLEIAWNIISLTFIINAKDFMIGQYSDRKWSGRETGGWDWERSESREWNSGHPKHNSTICQCAAHKAINATKVYFLKRCHPIDTFCTIFPPESVFSYLQPLVDMLCHMTCSNILQTL